MALTCTKPEQCARLAAGWSLTAADRQQWPTDFRGWRGRSFGFSKHLLKRQGERGISVADIRAVMTQGQLVHVRHDRRMRSTRYTLLGRLASGRILHVVVEEVEEMWDLTIITAYDPAGFRDIWNPTFTQRLHWCIATDEDGE